MTKIVKRPGQRTPKRPKVGGVLDMNKKPRTEQENKNNLGKLDENIILK